MHHQLPRPPISRPSTLSYCTSMASYTPSSYHALPFPTTRPPTMSYYTMPSYPIILPWSWSPIPCPLIPSSHSILPLSPSLIFSNNSTFWSQPSNMVLSRMLNNIFIITFTVFATDVSNDFILWRTYANYDPGPILASDLNCLQAENYSHF